MHTIRSVTVKYLKSESNKRATDSEILYVTT
jgi:hypothetical protein